MGSLSKRKAEKHPHIIVWSTFLMNMTRAFRLLKSLKHILIRYLCSSPESTNVNSWRPSDAYKCNYTGSSSFQIMACCLLWLRYHPTQLWHIVNESLGTHLTKSWIKIQQFPYKKMRDYMNTKISPARCRPSCIGLSLLNKDAYQSFLSTAQHVITKL